MEEYGKTRNFAYRNHREDRFDCLQPRKKMLKRRTPPGIFRGAVRTGPRRLASFTFAVLPHAPASCIRRSESVKGGQFFCVCTVGRNALQKGASSKCHTESKARKLVYSTASSQFVTLEVAFHQ